MGHRAPSHYAPAVGLILAGMLLCMLGASTGCKDKEKDEKVAKKPAAPLVVTGLDAVPGQARTVIAVDVKALRSSWLVKRAVEQMFRRDPGLAGRVEQLIRDCKFDPKTDLDSFVIAMGGANREAPAKAGDAKAGDAKAADTGATRDEALMVVVGTVQEAELASCVGQSVAADGGSLTTKQVDGRTFYRVGARSGRRDSVWFTVSGPRNLVIATSAEWLARAVGRGAKLASEPTMAALLAKVDRRAGIWAIGQVDERVGAGLVDLTGGAVKEPPRAMFVSADLKAGASVTLGAEMYSAEDARSLISLIKSQLALGALAAQRYGLGTLVQKLGVDAEGKTVYLRLALREDEVRRVLSQIDTPTGSTQNSAEN